MATSYIQKRPTTNILDYPVSNYRVYLFKNVGAFDSTGAIFNVVVPEILITSDRTLSSYTVNTLGALVMYNGSTFQVTASDSVIALTQVSSGLYKLIVNVPASGTAWNVGWISGNFDITLT